MLTQSIVSPNQNGTSKLWTGCSHLWEFLFSLLSRSPRSSRRVHICTAASASSECAAIVESCRAQMRRMLHSWWVLQMEGPTQMLGMGAGNLWSAAHSTLALGKVVSSRSNLSFSIFPFPGRQELIYMVYMVHLTALEIKSPTCVTVLSLAQVRPRAEFTSENSHLVRRGGAHL